MCGGVHALLALGEVRRWLCSVGFFLLPLHWFLELNLGHQACLQVPLPTELSWQLPGLLVFEVWQKTCMVVIVNAWVLKSINVLNGDLQNHFAGNSRWKTTVTSFFQHWWHFGPPDCLLRERTVHWRMFSIIFLQTQDANSTRLLFAYVSRCACQVALFENRWSWVIARGMCYFRKTILFKNVLYVFALLEIEWIGMNLPGFPLPLSLTSRL